jgi:hypothetical protein
VARFLQPVFLQYSDDSHFVFLRGRMEQVRMDDAAKSEYDVYSAVTFFLVGVGVGSVLALVFNPRQRAALEAIASRRSAA